MGEDPAKVFSNVFTYHGVTAPRSDYTRNRFLHQKCDRGRPMKGSTDPCVQAIMAQHPHCETGKWDQVCVAAVTSICGRTCGDIEPGVKPHDNNKSLTCHADICAVMPPGKAMGNGCDGHARLGSVPPTPSAAPPTGTPSA